MCQLAVRVFNPFDGFFDLKLTDGSGETYHSVMSLDDVENLRSVGAPFDVIGARRRITYGSKGIDETDT
jgi:hypothetical protein